MPGHGHSRTGFGIGFGIEAVNSFSTVFFSLLWSWLVISQDEGQKVTARSSSLKGET